MKLIRIFYLLLSSLLLLSCGKPEVSGDIIIENALVVDGTGSEPYQADVIIENNKIKWIGNRNEIKPHCTESIDATGMILTPGFIDMHAHGDPLSTPDFENFLAMGVTTIVLGMDGSSVRSSDLVSWMADVDSVTTGVNILPFIGHGTLRRESGIDHSEDVTDAQISELTSLLKNALDQGVWGLSFGLEYLPGYYADSIELRALAKVVGEHNALITSHIRNEDNDQINKSLKEMFDLSAYCNVNISHLKVVYGKGKERAQEIMKLFGEPLNDIYKITADLYPYTASYTGIGIVFPEWAKRPKTYAQIKESRRKELLTHLRNRVMSRNGPDATLFGSAPYKGKTLKDLSDEYNLPFEVVLADVVGPYGGSAAFFVMDEELQRELVKHPAVMIASDGSPTMYHPRGHATFSKVIEEYVEKDSTLSLATAIYKMSGLPAQTLGLEDRGTITEGKIADLLIFNPSDIKSNATFEDPHLKAEGISRVIMNGEVVYEEGEIISKKGVVIRRKNRQ